MKNKRNEIDLWSSVHKKFGLNCIQQWFSKVLPCLNVELDLWSGSALLLNLEPNLGPVLKSSGSNFGSEPNCAIPTIGECFGSGSIATAVESGLVVDAY